MFSRGVLQCLPISEKEDSLTWSSGSKFGLFPFFRLFPCTVRLHPASHFEMNAAMPCPEYMGLRQQYVAALQRWGDVLLAQHAGLLDGDVQSAVKHRKNVADERDAAHTRMEDHKLSCPVCKHNSSKPPLRK